MKHHTSPDTPTRLSSSSPPESSSPPDSASRRLLRLAGRTGALAALGAAPPAARAAGIVPASGSFPLSPPALNGGDSWDVDGDGTVDFLLGNLSSEDAFIDDLNGGRLVVPGGATSDQNAKLNMGFAVGPTLASGFKFHTAAQVFNMITNMGAVGVDAVGGGWTYGDTGFFGFKFTSGASTFYGWGELTIGDRGNSGNGDNYRINRAYYESAPGTAITVGALPAVPEPSAAALLALGAAGLGSWRRRKQDA